MAWDRVEFRVTTDDASVAGIVRGASCSVHVTVTGTMGLLDRPTMMGSTLSSGVEERTGTAVSATSEWYTTTATWVTAAYTPEKGATAALVKVRDPVRVSALWGRVAVIRTATPLLNIAGSNRMWEGLATTLGKELVTMMSTPMAG